MGNYITNPRRNGFGGQGIAIGNATFNKDGICSACGGKPVDSPSVAYGTSGGYSNIYCSECNCHGNIFEVFKHSVSVVPASADLSAIKCMEWCKNEWSNNYGYCPEDKPHGFCSAHRNWQGTTARFAEHRHPGGTCTFSDEGFVRCCDKWKTVKQDLVKEILTYSGGDKSVRFNEMLVKTRVHILGELGKSTSKFTKYQPDFFPISSDGWSDEAKAALTTFKNKNRRLISTGAPPVDTSLPTTGSALVPPPQESGIWMLALSILPLLVILYLIRRFYKSFKAPRRDSEDFVNLEMLLVIPKDL